MTDDNRRKKAQAVFFSIVMVLSMVAGSAAIAGSAAAAAPGDGGSLSVSDPVQSTTEVTIEDIGAHNVSQDGSLNILAVNTSGDVVGDTNIPDGSVSEEETWNATFTAGDLGVDEGDYDIYLSSDTETKQSLVSGGSITVDDTAPEINSFSPADGEIVNDVNQDITVEIDDNVTDTGDLSIEANVDVNGDINTYRINPDNPGDDGVSLDGTTLTISPTGDDVPELEEGTVDVSIEATDAAGNSASNSSSFEVDLSDAGSDFTAPGQGAVTNDVNETVEVQLTSDGAEINNSEADLTIDGPTGFTTQSYTYEDDAYDNSSNTFVVEPDGGDSIASFSEDGKYDVTVTGVTEAGTEINDAYTFYVDTEEPSVNDVSLDDADINSTDVEDGVSVTVTFDGVANSDQEGVVTANSINANLDIDGQTVGVSGFDRVDNFDAETTDSYAFEADISDELDSYGAVENDSATVNVTGATEDVGNELTDDASGASEAGFEIDTDGPSVELGELPNDGTLSGYVNASTFIANTDDVNTQTVEIWVGGESSAAISITDDANSLDTTQFPDGNHVIGVLVEDDSGNTDLATTEVTLDNGDDVTVQDDFLAGTNTEYAGNSYAVPVDGQFNLSTDVFDNSGSSDVSYTIDNGSGTFDDLSGDALVFDANDYSDGETATLEADGVTVDVVVNRLTIFDATTESSENPSTLTVESNREDLDELNVTVQDNDDYVQDESVSLTRGNFTVSYDEVDEEYDYTADVPDLSDGNFNVTVDDAQDDAQAVEPDVTSGDFEVDNSEPSVVGATIVDGNTDRLTLEVVFDEPIDSLSTDHVSVEGTSAEVIGSQWHLENAETGVATLTFDEEFQTADKPNLTIEADHLQEAYHVSTPDTGATNSEATETGVYTSVQTFEEGLTPMSIPAETGSVAIDDLEVNGDVDAIWAYDGESWSSYSFGDGEEGPESNDLTHLEGGQGYLLSTSGSASVAVNAENVPSGDTNQAIQSQQVTEGWNLIGHYQEGSQSVGQALAPLGDSTYSVQDGYTGTQVNQLEAGNAYWLFTDEQNYHVPVEYEGMNSEQPSVHSVQVSPDPVTNDTELDISTEVSSDNPVQNVMVESIPEIGVDERVPLTDGNRDGVYNATITTDFSQELIDSGETEIGANVVAIDIYGNSAGTSTSFVAGDIRKGSLAFNDQVLSDNGNVVVEDVDSNTDATLEVRNNTGDVVGSTAISSDISAENVSVDVSGTSPGTHTAVLVTSDNVELASADKTVYSGSVTVDDQDQTDANEITVNSSLSSNDNYAVVVFDQDWNQLGSAADLSGEASTDIVIGDIADNSDVTAVLYENDESASLAKATDVPDLSGNVSDTGDINVPQSGTDLTADLTSNSQSGVGPSTDVTHTLNATVGQSAVATEEQLSEVRLDYSAGAFRSSNGDVSSVSSSGNIESFVVEREGADNFAFSQTNIDAIDVNVASGEIQLDVSNVNDADVPTLQSGDNIVVTLNNYENADDGTYNVDVDVKDESNNVEETTATLDLESPTVSGVSADGTTTNDTVSVTFTEALDSTTVQNADFQVDKDTSVNATEDYDDTGGAVTDLTIQGTELSEDRMTVTIELDSTTVLDDAENVRASVVIDGASDDSVADDDGNTAPTGVGGADSSASTGTITTA